MRADAIFIFSPDARDDIVSVVERLGRRVVAARRPDGLVDRFRACDAAVALVDARGDPARAAAAVAILGGAAEQGGAALIALVDEDRAVPAALFDAGATHHATLADLPHALRYAERHAERVSAFRTAGRPRLPVTAARTHRDPLTGLADADGARLWLGRATDGGAAPPVLLLMAISRFEMLNEAFGRAAGDALLRNVARRVERLADEPDMLVARVGGAAFLVGLPAPAGAEKGRVVARAMAAAVSRPFAVGGELATLAVHVGVALGDAGEDGGALLRRAGAALAEAQASDGDPVRLLDARDEGVAAGLEQLEIDLRQALSAQEIAILYQPQISVANGRVVGVEALARWNHPRLGELGAETLFAAAERSDYVVQLSRHVQRQVVAEVASWPAVLAHLCVAINVTAAEIALPGFADEFCRMLDDGGLARDRVTVEVTESGLIGDLSEAAALLARLRTAGLRVAIDDFGTGYSSLAYLKALPLDYLKIDRHLSQDIVGSPRDRVVVRGVIDMARSLDLVVVAEGVETTRQLALLAEEGCNLYQGFIFAPPLGAADLATMVAGWQRGTPPGGRAARGRAAA